MAEKPPVLFINSPYPAALQRLNEHFTIYNDRDADDRAVLWHAGHPSRHVQHRH